MTLKCNKCSYIWQRTPSNIKKSKGCPKCLGKARLSLEEVKLICSERNISFQSKEFINCQHRHEFKCNICSYIWHTKFSCICKSTCCPKCALKKGIENRKKLGSAPYAKMWKTLRSKYGPNGGRTKLTFEELKNRKKINQRKYRLKQRSKNSTK